MQKTEGYVEFRNYKTYYNTFGNVNGGKTPLIALHGGPGYTHHHLENLADLAERGQPVILYDQLGCGKSDRPDNPGLWTIELFIDELKALRQSLHLHDVSLLGHSWGGTLALEYMYTKPTGVEKLILSSPLLDTALWVTEAKRLIGELPDWAADIMQEHEANETTDTYEYAQAYGEFKKRHICRVEPYPQAMIASDTEAGAQVYNTMWGPSETHVTGSLHAWTALDRMQQITIPTLFISGKYDEATPKQIEAAHNLLPDSSWVLLEHSSHTGNLEEPKQYLDTVYTFLTSETVKSP